MSSSERYDVLLLGATGFVGRLITRYLTNHPERSSFTLGLGARSKSKIEKLFEDPEVTRGNAIVVQVDVLDDAQVEDAVRRAKVVINTVGPYWNWGTPVVRACARHGVHYVDLTGESPWIKDIIFNFDYLATKTKAIILPSCGMDSVPSDFSVYLANKALKEVGGPDTEMGKSITSFKVKGGISGGTLSSAITTFESVPKDKLDAARVDYALSPIRGDQVSRPRIVYSLPHVRASQVGGFFFMSPVNKANVQRTWGLFELAKRRAMYSSSDNAKALIKANSYGHSLEYDEYMYTGSTASAVLLSVGFGVIGFCFAFLAPFRWLVKNFATQPGQGPSEDVLRNGFLKTTNITSSAPKPGQNEVRVRSTIVGRGDPGYFLTAIMISEAALAMILEYDRLPEFAKEGGILTPAYALGDVFVERLRGSGKFDFEYGPLKDDEDRKTR